MFLGLFSNSHMTYDALRNYTDEPSLAEMTIKAIEVLERKNSTGYVLMVEGGKIDHAHHQNFAGLAMAEVMGLDKAVEAAVKRVKSDTLVIVTADHSHSVTFNGYPGRGNDILGECEFFIIFRCTFNKTLLKRFRLRKQRRCRPLRNNHLR